MKDNIPAAFIIGLMIGLLLGGCVIGRVLLTDAVNHHAALIDATGDFQWIDSTLELNK